MKNILLIPSIILSLAVITAPSLTGRSQGNPVTSKVYAADSSGTIRDSAVVDIYGNYTFNHLKPGQYNFTFKKTGYHDILIGGVTHLEANMAYRAKLDYTLIKPEVVAATRADGSATYIDGIRVITKDRTEDVSDYSVTEDSEKPIERLDSREPAIEMTKTAAYTGSVTRGVAEVFSTEKISKSSLVDEPISAEFLAVEGSGPKSEKAGQLTAGYWRDLDNWSKWEETNKDPNINQYKKAWNFHVNHRFSAKFLDAKNQPVIGEKVNLIDEIGNKIWEAVTDNLGQVELWANLQTEMSLDKSKEYRLKLIAQERVFDFKIKTFSGGSETFSLPVTFQAAPVADIAFVVDATGSMGDEISYLQAELLDVITRVKQSNKCLDIRIGSVFYRDNGDAYLTSKSDFSNNPLNTVDYILNQSAGGGGDFPEAVDAAMQTTLTEMTWSPKAISKIMFLILDAPPHDDSASIEKMNRYTKEAAAKGIKIIPVVASGINQSTEFLMKYLAIATNGTYIYLTDHSGIGNAHEKPTGVKENVQYLNDLMVDVINQNTVWNGCTDSTNNNLPTPGTVEIITDGQWQVQFYPNPAVDFITVNSNASVDQIQLYTMNGKLIKTLNQLGQKNKINVTDLSTGVYLVKCIKGEQSITCRMLVMH